tara:strand:- start:23754 stop:27137 length:3384 start_codon:yes stop_codon:yes gene_type:complete
MLGQEINNPDQREKRLAVRDTMVLDSVSINNYLFTVYKKNGTALDTTAYSIDYGRALFIPEASILEKEDTLFFKYRAYPEFLTKKYFLYDPDKVISSSGGLEKVYALQQETNSQRFVPFDGLQTSGSIVRGVTVGNNQNSTVNSELDLQITGRLSDKVGIRASLQDANIPQTQYGYSQRLDEFDQIFIELYSDSWNIRAGDINLVDTESYFGSFTKKVQGLSLNANIESNGSNTHVFATGAIVKGVYNKTNIQGQEGNQGPYKLTGPNGELYQLIISGSERVYVNSVLLERGENEDYVIDYNAGELRFNPTFPINSEMRIVVEYQYSEQNYTRIIAHGGGSHETANGKFRIRANVYSENDAKNQPLQQNLNQEQVDVLTQAGDNPSLMVAPSAVLDQYSDNKILYRKDLLNGQEIFVFSNNQDDELYNVRFTQVGTNQGNYIITNTTAVSRIYEYVAPINGVMQGDYEPIVQLIAPTKLQLATISSSYDPSEKTHLAFELAGSKRDLNLFSGVDDDDNNGFAGHFEARQLIVGSRDSTHLESYASLDHVDSRFQNIERNFNIEFNRDWNLPTQATSVNGLTLGTGGFNYSTTQLGNYNYQFEHLNYANNYAGSRHTVHAAINRKKINGFLNASYLKTHSDTLSSAFLRLSARTVKGFKKTWVGTKFQTENNERRDTFTNRKDSLTQRFFAYEAFAGIGDSTAVFAEVGYRQRFNDSLRGNDLQRVNHSNTYYLKSQLIKSRNTSLGLYVNYRTLKYEDKALEDENSLNSRLIYDQYLVNRLIRWNTVYETNSGTLPQQEFSYLRVDEGQGTHTWIDYNNDGIQQLQEFEVAQFQDEADYLKVLLPNRVFVKTHQNKLSQILTLNPQQWSGQEGIKKFLSHFYNQTSYLLDRKILREGSSFDLNPFNSTDDELGLNLSLRNTFFYNRGKQRYTTSYTYLATSTKNLLTIGLQESKLRSHQVNFLHKIKNGYIFNLRAEVGYTQSNSQNYASRNYKIDNQGLNPKISYLINDRSRIEGFYAFAKKENTQGGGEKLNKHDLGIALAYANAGKISLNGEIKYIKNDFEGSNFTPVSYQMLEGLQPGSNFTWSLLAQKRLTKFLDLNVNYFGRNSENTRTIHTGTVQLRAFF